MMMLELPKAHFDRVKPLFDVTQPLSTMIFSALEGRTLGRAFVDDIDHPSNCLLVTNFYNFSFTHAAVDQQWLNETVTELRLGLSFVLDWPPQSIPLVPASRALEGAADDGAGTKEDKPTTLQPPPDFSESFTSLEFLEYTPQGILNLPANRQLRDMDADLFARAMWRKGMMMAYGTVENFLANAIGLCVMDGDKICSEAYAIFLGAGKFEIGIVTNEKYRQQGNGYLACKALLPIVEKMGYLPNWSYRASNVASGTTARKLGFRTPREHVWFHYPQMV
jgi:hypothetical protein